MQRVRADVGAGMPPEQVAEAVLGAVRHKRLYILPNLEGLPMVEQHLQDILQQLRARP